MILRIPYCVSSENHADENAIRNTQYVIGMNHIISLSHYLIF